MYSIKLQVQQQHRLNNLGASDWKWPRDLGTYIFIPIPAVAIFSEATTLHSRRCCINAITCSQDL